MKTTVYFKYGAMNSGKTLELLKVAYNYEENKVNLLIIKPKIDSRMDGHVFSRTGLKKEAMELKNEDIDELKVLLEKKEVILIDESQFFNEKFIEEIVNQGYINKVHTIMFFGLKNDFSGKLFPGSKRIIELADKIEEATSICWCGRKARQNARIVNEELVKNGPTVLVDDENTKVKYVTLCNYHYFIKKFKK